VESKPPLAPGLRQTQQRRLVWEAVRLLGGHCTAEQIAAAVQRARPGLARSTVYRALEALTSSGALHAVRLGEGAVHYEVAGEAHHHAICQSCQGILHLEDELVAELEEHLERRHHFKPMRTEVLVVGLCARCAQARRPVAPRKRTLDHVHYDT
jgi:Fur family ferric uptake transcriptional regulator